MKKIEKFVTHDSNETWRLRALLSKLRAQLALHDENQDLNLDTMKQLVHEIEFDFYDYKFIQEDTDTLLEAHNIIKENE